MTPAGRNEIIRFALPIACLGVWVVGLAVRLVYLHCDLVTSKPAAPKYDFERVIQGQRGSIISSSGVTLAKTTSVWEYHLDPVEATKDPINPKRPISAIRRMEKMKMVSDNLGIPLPKVMDA